jgi:hypothetical protein
MQKSPVLYMDRGVERIYHFATVAYTASVVIRPIPAMKHTY